MCCTKLLALTFFCLCNGLVFAQERFTAYIQPQVALNYKVGAFYNHNFSVENRNYLVDEGDTQLRVRHLHFAHFSNLKILDNQSLALGIQYRFRENFDDGQNELRLTQQFNVTKQPFIVRYGHRIRTEQRITSSKTIHRFRYRFSVDFPLKGERLDVGEPYLVGNLETLLSVAKDSRPEYDQRFTLNLGWQLNKQTKLQVGSEYRFENFLADTQNVLFFLSTLNFSL